MEQKTRPKKSVSMENKWKKISCILLSAVLLCTAAAGIYWYYVFTYRSVREPKTDLIATNRDPALYTLPGQMKALEKYKMLHACVFYQKSEQKEHGTYVIPGLRATRTLTGNTAHRSSICTSMTPQGIAVTKKYLLISAYCKTKEHNSVLYLLDKTTHQFKKEVVLGTKAHVGGLAYDDLHEQLWVATHRNGVASVSCVSLKKVLQYSYPKRKRPLFFDSVYPIYTLKRSSFLTYYENALYVGYFCETKDDSLVQKFDIKKDGSLKLERESSISDQEGEGRDKDTVQVSDTWIIPYRIQGMLIHNGMVFFSQSGGCRDSRLVIFTYDEHGKEYKQRDEFMELKMPPQLEQINGFGTDLYMVFESAVYAYGAYPITKIDRVLQIEILGTGNKK